MSAIGAFVALCARKAPKQPLIALALLGLMLLPSGAAATPQTTTQDVEDEVMCPICGTLLELSDSPQARRQKVYVAKLVAAGESKAEIKDALVAQYGPAVLALPEPSGFDLSAYLVPILAILAAIVALAFGVARWRRDSDGDGGGDERSTGPRGSDAERLEADLSRYDL
jgi:cytochrome c-type biogenesis protein CcmH